MLDLKFLSHIIKISYQITAIIPSISHIPTPFYVFADMLQSYLTNASSFNRFSYQ